MRTSEKKMSIQRIDMIDIMYIVLETEFIRKIP